MRTSFGGGVRLSLGLSAFVLLVAAWIQLGFGLRPLSALRRELDRIREGRTDRLRGPFARELEPLAQDLNQLLDRQDELIRKAAEILGENVDDAFGEASRLPPDMRDDVGGLVRMYRKQATGDK